jgi:hypothetical protein
MLPKYVAHARGCESRCCHRGRGHGGRMYIGLHQGGAPLYLVLVWEGCGCCRAEKTVRCGGDGRGRDMTCLLFVGMGYMCYKGLPCRFVLCHHQEKSFSYVAKRSVAYHWYRP